MNYRIVTSMAKSASSVTGDTSSTDHQSAASSKQKLTSGAVTKGVSLRGKRRLSETEFGSRKKKRLESIATSSASSSGLKYVVSSFVENPLEQNLSTTETDVNSVASQPRRRGRSSNIADKEEEILEESAKKKSEPCPSTSAGGSSEWIKVVPKKHLRWKLKKKGTPLPSPADTAESEISASEDRPSTSVDESVSKLTPSSTEKKDKKNKKKKLKRGTKSKKAYLRISDELVFTDSSEPSSSTEVKKEPEVIRNYPLRSKTKLSDISLSIQVPSAIKKKKNTKKQSEQPASTEPPSGQEAGPGPSPKVSKKKKRGKTTGSCASTSRKSPRGGKTPQPESSEGMSELNKNNEDTSVATSATSEPQPSAAPAADNAGETENQTPTVRVNQTLFQDSYTEPWFVSTTTTTRIVTGENAEDGSVTDHGRLQAILEARGFHPHFLGALGPRMQHILQRSMGGSNTTKAMQLLQGLQATGDEGQQLQAVIEMCQMLVMGNEDSLVGFPVKQVVPALKTLLCMEHNFDMMNHACRALTYMMEALPRSSGIILDVLPTFLLKVQVIECIDVAEQSLTALEMLSRRHGKSILLANGVSAVLMYLDFFSIAAQRAALQITANCCTYITPEEFSYIQSSLPVLSSKLKQQDKKSVESICVAFSRLVDNMQSKKAILQEIAGDHLFCNFQQLLVASPSIISTTTFISVLKMLSTLCTKCPDLATSFLRQNIADTLCYLLTGSPGGVTDKEQIELVSRSPQELYEITCFIGELMPKLPTIGIFTVDGLLEKSTDEPAASTSTNTCYWQWRDDKEEWHTYSDADSKAIEAAYVANEEDITLATDNHTYVIDFHLMQHIDDHSGIVWPVQRKLNLCSASQSANQSPPETVNGTSSGPSEETSPSSDSLPIVNGTSNQTEKETTVDEKTLEELVSPFIKSLFNILYAVYNNSAGPSVRYKCLRALLRMVHFAPPPLLLDVLKNEQVSSHIAGMLASQDLRIVVGALQMAEMLMQKLPAVFEVHFAREGVMHQVQQLLHIPSSPVSQKAETSEESKPESVPPSDTVNDPKEPSADKESPAASKLPSPEGPRTPPEHEIEDQSPVSDIPLPSVVDPSDTVRAIFVGTDDYYTGIDAVINSEDSIASNGSSDSLNHMEAVNIASDTSANGNNNDDHDPFISEFLSPMLSTTAPSTTATVTIPAPSDVVTGYTEEVVMSRFFGTSQNETAPSSASSFQGFVENGKEEESAAKSESHLFSVYRRLTDAMKRKRTNKRVTGKKKNEDLVHHMLVQDVLKKANINYGQVLPGSSSSRIVAQNSGPTITRTRFSPGSTRAQFLATFYPSKWGKSAVDRAYMKGYLSSKSAGTCSISPENRESVKSWIRGQAAKFLEAYDKPLDAFLDDNMPESTDNVLFNLTRAIRKLENNPEESIAAFEELKKIIVSSDISPFEVNHSGFVISLTHYLTKVENGNTKEREQRIRNFLRVFADCPLNYQVLETEPSPKALSILINKLNSCVSQLEQFPVRIHEPASGYGTNTIRFFNTHQIKCQLLRHAECTNLKQWKGGIVKIDPLAVIQSIERYLFIRGYAKIRDKNTPDSDDENSDDDIDDSLVHLPLGSCSNKHKLQFLIGNHVLPYNMTVYQAVKQYSPAAVAEPFDEGEEQMIGPTNLWVHTHNIYYRPAPEEAIAKSSTSASSGKKGGKAGTSKAATKKKCDEIWNEGITPATKSPLDPYLVKNVSLTSIVFDASIPVLLLLRILHAVSRYWGCLYICTQYRPLVSQQEFVNPKISAKATRQLQDSLVIMTGNLPVWIQHVILSCPFLLPFETRQLLFYVTAFDRDRALQRVLDNSPDVFVNSQIETQDRITPRLDRRKKSVSRDDILKQAEAVIAEVATSKALLEVQYENEVGTGLGPTLEFYALVSKELQRSELELWSITGGGKSVDESYIFSSCGLFPSPLGRSTKVSQLVKIKSKFRFIGKLMAKALMDSRMLDLPFSLSFYRWLLGQETSLSVCDLMHVAPDVHKTLSELYILGQKKLEIESNLDYTEEERTERKKKLMLDGSPIEDIGLDFVLPGYPNVELKRGGKDIPVTVENVDQYCKLVCHWYMVEGISRQMESFREGFESVLPLSRLSLFYPEELDSLFCGTQHVWDTKTLMESLKPDHGYTFESTAIQYLIEILSSYKHQEQRDFLQFVTGSPRLPVGGFKALSPLLTVVRKTLDANENPDDFLPSVMTCVNYLKLPDYSSINIMRNKLHIAASEGKHSFYLS